MKSEDTLKGEEAVEMFALIRAQRRFCQKRWIIWPQ